jgi:hypothetical protein
MQTVLHQELHEIRDITTIKDFLLCSFSSQILMNVTVTHVMLMLSVQIPLDLLHANVIQGIKVQDFCVQVSSLLWYLTNNVMYTRLNTLHGVQSMSILAILTNFN